MPITCTTCGAARDLLSDLVAVKARYHATDPAVIRQCRDLDAMGALSEFLRLAAQAQGLLEGQR